MTKLINCFLTCSGLGRAWILSCKDGVSTVPKQNFKFSVKKKTASAIVTKVDLFYLYVLTLMCNFVTQFRRKTAELPIEHRILNFSKRQEF